MASFSLVIPLYNEKVRVDRSVERLSAYLLKNKNWEIIYVDDGSTDNSKELLMQAWSRKQSLLSDRGHAILYHQHQVNQGKGGAVRTGALLAKGDHILFTDFDISISLDYLNNFFQKHSQSKSGRALVIATRSANKDIEQKQSFLRKVLGRGFNFLMKVIVNVPFKDTQCGFKLFDRKTAHVLFQRQIISGFAFDVEMIKRALRADIPVYEVPVEIEHDDRDSTVNIYLDPFKMLKDLFILKWRLLFESLL
jgi:dolichyl-phosphate beta-glucosyltransferase